MTAISVSDRQHEVPTLADVASGDTALPPRKPRRWRLFRRADLTSNATQAGGGDVTPIPAGSFLIAIASFFAVASAAFLSGPLPVHILTDEQRIAMGLVWAGASLAFAGLAVLFRTLDKHLPPRGVAVLKARARFQRISRRQIRQRHQRFMRREFRDLVMQLGAV